jgi:hypothetical protein
VKRAEYEQWRLALDEGGAASTSTNKRIRQLERELARKEKALAEAAALLILKKKVDTLFGEDEDDDTNRAEREVILDLVAQAQASGARLAPACDLLGISARTVERWRTDPKSAIGAMDRITGQQCAGAH